MQPETTLVKFEAARHALAEARSIDEVKAIHDQATALKVYAKQIGESLEMQNDIVEIKLRAERRSGEMLKEMPKQHGARPSDSDAGCPKVTPSSAESRSMTPSLSDLGISRNQSSNWQREASIPEETFERHIAEVKADGEKELTTAGVLKLAKTVQAVAVTTFSSESNEYYTPAIYVEASRELMGAIDFDPASCLHAQKVIQATEFFTEEDDGLSQEWRGRVWLNPPYGKIGNTSSQGFWAQRLAKEYREGRVTEAVLLVKAAVGYEWFEELWDEWPVCFARKRLSFVRVDGNDDGQSKQGTVFFYMGKNIDKFSQIFGQFGRILLPGE